MKNRIAEIDIIKSIAIVGVVLIHLCAPGINAYEIGSFNWLFLIFLGSIIRASVPLFFMCSGQLMFNPDKKIDNSEFLRKYLPRLIIALFTWATAYEIFKLMIIYASTRSVYLTVIPMIIKNIIMFRHNGQLYFLHIIILFYLFVPVVRVYLSSAKKKDIEYLLILWFIFGITYPTLREIRPFSSLSGIPAQYAINMTYSSIGYGVLGFYIERYIKDINISGKYIMILGALSTFTGTVVLSIVKKENIMIFWQGMSPFVALLAIGIFLYVFKNTDRKKNHGLAEKLSKASFAIFLVHDFFNIIFNRFEITIDKFNPLIFVPVAGTVILVGSYIIYYVLSKNKIIKKYLI